MMRLPKGTRGVSAVGWSKDGNFISCTDLSDDHNVYLYSISNLNGNFTGSLVKGFPKKSGGNKIFMLSWSLMNDIFCTVGPKHIAFWDTTLAAGKKGIFGKTDPMAMNIACVTYDEKGMAYTGSQNGAVMRWQGTSMLSSNPIHKGVVHCIKLLHK